MLISLVRSLVEQVAARNKGDSEVAQMQARAEIVGKSEGKFVDQVAARNAGMSFVSEMEQRAAEVGKTDWIGNMFL